MSRIVLVDDDRNILTSVAIADMTSEPLGARFVVGLPV